MNPLPTELLSRACHIFLALAYPGGEQTIPEKKRAYLHLNPDESLASYLPPAPAAGGIGQILKGEDGAVKGYAFRLGSATFPYLKLQMTEYRSRGLWVFTVDTHDSFPRLNADRPESHPDFEAWTALQKANRQLKERIERAWEQDDLWTFNRLLRADLDEPSPHSASGT